MFSHRGTETQRKCRPCRNSNNDSSLCALCLRERKIDIKWRVSSPVSRPASGGPIDTPFSECGNSFAAFDCARRASAKRASPPTVAGRPLRPPCPPLCACPQRPRPAAHPKRPPPAAAEDGEDISPDPQPEDVEDREDAVASPIHPKSPLGPPSPSSARCRSLSRLQPAHRSASHSALNHDLSPRSPRTPRNPNSPRRGRPRERQSPDWRVGIYAKNQVNPGIFSSVPSVVKACAGCNRFHR